MSVWGSRVGRIVRVGAIAVVSAAVLLGLVSVGVASAAAVAPSWRIYSFSEPTHLVVPRNEVQRLTVIGTGGDVVIYGHGAFLEVPFNVTAEEMQLTLEAALGAGNVEVSGGPGDSTGSKPYLITYKGQLAGQAIGLFAFAGEGLEEAFIQQVTAAEPSGTVAVEAINVGGPTDGSTVTISDTLPAQLVGGEAHGFEQFGRGVSYSGAELGCESSGSKYSCVHAGVMETGDSLVLRVPVTALTAPPSTALNEGSVNGGGAEYGASTKGSIQISSTPAAFGLSPGSLTMATSSRQAGAHSDVTVAFQLATDGPEQVSGNLKDVHADMPPGLVGNTVGMPRCPTSKVVTESCPRDTIVGVATTTYRNLTEEGFRSPELYVSPVYNIDPSPGEPVAFMFAAVAFPVRLDTSVLSDGNYAVRVSANDLSEAAPVIGSTVTVWGVPAEHEGPGPIRLNNEERGELAGGLGGPAANVARVPLLSNPTQCSTPLMGSLEVDEWGNRDVFTGESASFGTMTDCANLAFSGSMSMLPDTLAAGEPAGYDFRLHVPQVNDPDGLSQPNVKKVVTTLPMGTVVSPSSAVGLKACSDEQFYGPVSERGLQQPAVPGDCPRDSQVGTVSIHTPALELPLTGDVYLATPDCEPCSPQDAQDGKMIRLFVQVVGEGGSGIVVKLEGHASLNQQTGQLTATFDNNPQLPFSDFQLTLAGGSRATLANSRMCGPESTTLDMTPWSNPFTTDLSASSVFEVNEACITPRFNPSFVSGTTNIQAGAYSPFTLSFGREDTDEFLNGLQMQMPQGLLGSLSGIPLCKEPQAAQGTCSDASLIGHTQVLTGPGQTPFLVTGGKVFLTEGYKGAPFGLSIAVPAKAGPYTLTGTTGTGMVVVRAAINIDPHTAALTVTSDPLPTVLDGIPLQLKVVNVTIDRPDFTFNPTSCAKMAITGAMSSKESGGAHVASPFQVTNCAGLGFKPRFKVSTNGHTSRKNGASLDAKVIYPAGAKYANIAKVKVDLPKQLPSRLTTLQKACPAAKFNANPDGCPRDSIVGIARANTPILPVQLTGPAYFVSHGGEEFPNLVIVLQGYGVRVDLIGDTFINEKTNVTSSTFNQVPDVPINSFELYLPQGRDSALAANGNLCKSSLKMPTAFTAQNGATLRQTTSISVAGCKAAGKARKARRARAAKSPRRSKGKRTVALKVKSADERGR